MTEEMRGSWPLTDTAGTDTKDALIEDLWAALEDAVNLLGWDAATIDRSVDLRKRVSAALGREVR